MTRPATRRAIKPTASQPKRSRETRERLLEMAGQVFAEKGYERATAKEIAERAGINAAAVNYYFGGVDELYLAVIEEARRRSVTYDKLAAAIHGKTDPMEKLQTILDYVLQMLTGPFASSWMARIFAREMVSPSPVVRRAEWRDAQKRFSLIRELVGEYVGLPPDHPDVAYAVWSLIAPTSLLLVADRKRLAQMFPEMDLSENGAPALAKHFASFAWGGLQAVGAGRRPGTDAPARMEHKAKTET